MRTKLSLFELEQHLENFTPKLSGKVKERALAMAESFNNYGNGTDGYLDCPVAPNVKLSLRRMFEFLKIDII